MYDYKHNIKKMDLKIKGKKALITGGSHGIGLAIKKALEVEGVECISWSRKEGVDFDFGIPLQNIIQLKDVDIIINNFGGGGTWKSEDANKVMNNNYGLTQRLTRKWLSYKKKWGRVITISSIYGKEKGYNAEFTAAKAAQIAFMKSLAGRYPGITFNTICPGCINTKPSIKKYAKEHNMSLGKPEDVVGIVTFLCSSLASHIDGATITCDGGESHSF